MATLSEMASGIAKQATSIGMEAATLALRLADAECKVTDRMQGVDCPLCEDMTPHTHGAHSPEYDHECGRTCAGDGCVCPCHTTESAPIASTAQADWDDQHRGKTPASGPCSAPGNWSLPDPVMLLSAKPQPAPVDGNLAERAHNVFISAPSEPWKAVIRLVQRDSNARWMKAIAKEAEEHGVLTGVVGEFVAGVHERLESKPKTLEERVTIENRNGSSGALSVCVDGNVKIKLAGDDARIYRLGLIAELAKEQK